MNIFVLVKRTFDTEEKLLLQMARFKKMVLNLSLILMMSMQLKKRFKCVMPKAVK